MEDVTEQAVLRAIDAMQERMGEQLTVDDLARAAMFSKFHFTRIFQRVTGVSPARFLSALRLQRAKNLLVSTSLNVADISVNVGYNSVGTFSSRFSRSVGMSPTTYRRRSGFAPAIRPDLAGNAGHVSNARLSCRVGVDDIGTDNLIFVGMFANRVPEGTPVRCTVLRQPGRLMFDAVPLGTWYLLAQAVPADCGAPAGDEDIAVASYGPFTVRPDSTISAELALRPSRALDPPVLLALLDARKDAMSRLQEKAPRFAAVA